MQRAIEQFCMREDLSTGDPYDIWKTKLGFHVKNYFNCHKRFGLLVAAPLVFFDSFVNNRARLFYTRQEYPIVRAFAALSLLNLYRQSGNPSHLEFAKKHLQWLSSHSCKGYSGACWGLHFDYAVSCGLIYDSNTPFSTMTPYALEAFIEYSRITHDGMFDGVIKSIYDFFEKDIQVMEESDEYIATSYVPKRDRIVINAVSYAMYSYSLLLQYVEPNQEEYVANKVRKLYAYIQSNQRPDGSWLYSPQGESFIDCFHSCIVIKNLLKANRLVRLDGATELAENGYRYLKENFLNKRYWLVRRFSMKNKPSLVRFDLYDNAEMLNLAIMFSDYHLADQLANAIDRYFCNGHDVYSEIDFLGIRRNKNTLRWAVLPYVYALSQLPGYMLSRGNVR